MFKIAPDWKSTNCKLTIIGIYLNHITFIGNKLKG